MNLKLFLTLQWMYLPRKTIFFRNKFSLTLLRLRLNFLRVSWKRYIKFYKISNNSIFIISIDFNSKRDFCICLLIIYNTKTKKTFEWTIHSILNQIKFTIWWYKGDCSIIFEFSQSNTLMEFNILNINSLFRSTTLIDIKEFLIIESKY